MEKIAHSSLEDFYREMAAKLGKDLESIFPKAFIRISDTLMYLILPKRLKRQSSRLKCPITGENITKSA